MASSVTMKAKGALPIGKEQVGVEFIARENGAQVGELKFRAAACDGGRVELTTGN